MDVESFYRAKIHYEARGYKYIDLPWHTSRAFQEFTLPPGTEPSLLKMHDAELCLVGSAEQSFIEAFDTLPDGRYYAITPCFRNESIYDDQHKRYFMKLELVHKGSKDFWRLFNDAKTFFESYLSVGWKSLDDKKDVDIFTQTDGEEIELGSYGWRNNKHHIWSYGTGLAQPRLNYAINR